MAYVRNLVNWLSNQRVDAGNMIAQQRNLRRNLRRSLDGILFGRNAAQRARVYGQFRVTANGPPDAEVVVSNGTILGLHGLADGSFEGAEVFGADSASEKSVDFSALANSTYTIWVRYSEDPGVPGVRIFYDAATDEEAGSTVDTELVHDWDVQAAVSSPGTEWVALADVVWGGSTITSGNITNRPHLFWEGDADAAYAHEWGDGGNDRDTDRAQYGINGGLHGWAQAVRRQLSDIIGATSTGWYSAIPATLTQLAAHLADTSDPHGSSLTQTNLTLSTLVSSQVMLLENSSAAAPTEIMVIPAACFHAFVDYFAKGVDPSSLSTAHLDDGGTFTGDLVFLYTNQSSADVVIYVPIFFRGIRAGSELKRISFNGFHGSTPPTVTMDIVAIAVTGGAASVIASIDNSSEGAGNWDVDSGALSVSLSPTTAYIMRITIGTDGSGADPHALHSCEIVWERERIGSWGS